ncbi:hypothetical protein GJ698_01825 [Pseudoduganella sp. FT26W]|uniref:Uncharacterized protein n=1 Tax=Duganella aquatilis TaxID=2666082 RepID=A0A844D6K5_9BURK|nr:hypothetical protein [Duganella aquatilis]MRW82829.1 hypothetical protein [Duganella aquatilis]
MDKREVKDVEMYFFEYTDGYLKKKRVKTRYRLTVEEAAVRFAGRDPVPVPGTLEVRTVGWGIHDNSWNTGMFMGHKPD